MGGGGQSPKPQPLQGFGISVTTALNGIPRAVVFGTNRLNGNVIDYTDFTATQQGGGGKGGKGGGKGITGGLKGQNGQFTYSVTLDVGICVGPVQGVGDVWETTSSPVSIPNLGSGATVFDGTDGQGPWSYMTSTHPDRAIGYNGLAHVAVPNMNLGSSPSLPNLTFEMLGLGIAASINPWAPKKGAKAWTTTYTPLSGLSGPFATIAGIVKPPATVQNDVVFDTSPAWCIAAVLTDTQFGCGFDQSLIGDLTDFTTWCQAQGIFFSPIMVSQREARSYLQDWFKACLADPYWSEGKIKIGIYADQPVTGTAADGSSLTFTPNTTSVMSIDDTVMLPGQSKDEGPLTVTRKDPADIANVIVVDYHERDYGYNDLPARVTDEALIADYGYHPGPNITGDFITQGAVAQRVADLLLARETGNLETYDWRMGGLAALLEPFDIVDLNDEAMGMSSYPARMLSIEEEDDTVFHCQAEEVPGLVGGMVERPVAVAAGATSSANADPGNVNTPFFFEPPSALTQAGSGLELWAFLSGQDLADWGGCQINISTDGNTYTSVLPSQIGAARMGVSTTALASVSQAASGPTYDTVNTITVDLSESGGELLSTDQAGALALNTLCVVDQELISYTTATLVSENVYQLSGLVRGAYGTDIAAHSAGAQFARVDGIQFRYPFTADRIGQTINFKFLSFNQFGANPQDLDQVSAFSYALQGAALSYAPGNVTGLTPVFSAGQTLLQWTAVPDPRAIDYE